MCSWRKKTGGRMEQRYGAPAFMRRALVCASAALTFCVCFAGGKDVQLVQGGRAIAEIVIAADADKAARFAATDLKWHLEKMTGVSFDIVTPETSHPSSLPICVGDSSLTQVKGSDLAPQRFCVSVQADRIELVGRDREDKGPLTFVIDEAGTPSGRDWRKAVIVVNDARDNRSPWPEFCRNPKYRPLAASNRITLHINLAEGEKVETFELGPAEAKIIEIADSHDNMHP